MGQLQGCRSFYKRIVSDVTLEAGPRQHPIMSGTQRQRLPEHQSQPVACCGALVVRPCLVNADQ